MKKERKRENMKNTRKKREKNTKNMKIENSEILEDYQRVWLHTQSCRRFPMFVFVFFVTTTKTSTISKFCRNVTFPEQNQQLNWPDVFLPKKSDIFEISKKTHISPLKIDEHFSLRSVYFFGNNNPTTTPPITTTTTNNNHQPPTTTTTTATTTWREAVWPAPSDFH